MKLNTTMIAGLTAAAVSAALMATTPAQAESRTFAYGTYGGVKYEGVGSKKARRSSNRSFNNKDATLRFGNSGRRHNLSSGNSYRSKIKISR
ncbi:MAG: hypothetical protein OER56_08435 [Hyphomicrobiales bacterium]|nr:hypothetical protein [Hyphomicrobiales bacterium]